MNYKLAIFDLDGTLLNTYAGVRAGVQYIIKTFGLEPRTEEQMRSFVGPPVYRSLMNHYGMSEERAKEIQQTFREYYVKEALYEAEVYDGLIETLQELRSRGIRTSVATYKREDMAVNVLHHFGVDAYLDGIFGCDADNTRSKSDIIRMAIADAKIPTEQSLMIGDTDNDAKGAMEIGVPFLAVSYGFGFKQPGELEQFPHVGCAATPKEILQFF